MKFQIEQPYYRNATAELFRAGSTITLTPNELPSRQWTPLDDEAKAALQKLKDADASREKLRGADLKEMSPTQMLEHIARLVEVQVQAQMAAKSPPPSDPKKGPKKDEPARGKDQASPL